MQLRKEIPEPFNSFVRHYGDLSVFLREWNIPMETFRRWTKNLEKGRTLSRGATLLIEKIQATLKQKGM
jgi:hypothetical protein